MDSLQIIEHLHSFYSSAFSQLVTYTIALLGFVGIVIPLLIQYIQNRSLRLEKESLEILFNNKFEEVRTALSSVISERFLNERKAVEESIHKELDRATASIKNEVADAQGGLYHLQGNSRLNIAATSLAVTDYCKAAGFYFRSTSEHHLQTVLRNIYKLSLPRLHIEDFKSDADLNSSLAELIALLESNNLTGRYTLVISDIKQGIIEAKKRAKPTSAS